MIKEIKLITPKILKSLIELHIKNIDVLDAFQKAIANKTYKKLKMSIFKQENEELITFIQTADEKKQSAEVFNINGKIKFNLVKYYSQKCIDMVLNKCNATKRKSKSKLTEAKMLLKNMDPNDAQFPHRDFYNSLPNCLENLSESIHDFCGRLYCMDDLESDVRTYRRQTALKTDASYWFKKIKLKILSVTCFWRQWLEIEIISLYIDFNFTKQKTGSV